MAMVDDSAAMLEATNPTLKAVVGDNEERCDTCKLIVTQVATMLRNPVRATSKRCLLHVQAVCIYIVCFCLPDVRRGRSHTH